MHIRKDYCAISYAKYVKKGEKQMKIEEKKYQRKIY